MLSAKTKARLEGIGISRLSEIQEKAIPAIKNGGDVVIKSETGSGKTFAFLIPVAEMEGGKNSALILAPTRELAKQIFSELKKISSKYAAIVYGGVPMDSQIRQLEKSEVVIGTPGRILDLINRGYLDLSNLKISILDEFDRMLEMGFREDVEEILSHAPEHQRVFVSATIKEEVRHLIEGAEVVSVERGSMIPDTLEQYYVDAGSRGKMGKFLDFVRSQKGKVLVFTSTKRMSSKLADIIKRKGMKAEAINGDMSQKAREHVLEMFKQGRIKVLVATDVASRGIHVNDIDVVANFDCPSDVESYIHRIGRTARQGRKGIAITFIESRDYRSFQRIMDRFRGQMKKYSKVN